MNVFLRVLSVVLVCVFVFSLSACKKNKTEDNTSVEDSHSSDISFADDASSEDVSSDEVSSEENSQLTGGDVSSDSSQESQPSSSQDTSSSDKVDFKKLIIGKWKGDQNITDYLRAEGYEPPSQVIIIKHLEFADNGVLYHSVDFTNFYKEVMPVVAAKVNKDISDNYEDKEDFEAKNGVSVSDYIDETVNMFSSWLCFECDYNFEGDRLYITEQGGGETSVLSEYGFEDNDNLYLNQNGIKYYLTRFF